MNRQRSILAIGCGLIALLLGAPAPGSVGGCSEDSIAADPQEFCLDHQELECLRRKARGELDDPGTEMCRANVPNLCVGFAFPSGCTPSTLDTGACLGALRSTDPAILNLMFNQIPACRDLCL